MFKIHYYLNEIKIRTSFLLFSFLIAGFAIYLFIDQFFYIFTNFFFQIKENASLLKETSEVSNTMVRSILSKADLENASGEPTMLPLFQKNRASNYPNSLLPYYLIFTDIPEAFKTSLSLSLGFSLYIHIPLIVYQLWSFTIPSLFSFERKTFSKFCIFFLFLYILGTFLIYSLVFPVLSNFFFNFQTNNDFLHIHCEPRISSYISFILKISLISQLIFQLPFFISIFFYLKLFSLSDILENRRIIYWFILLFSAFVAPPDFFIQFGLSFCFTFFLETMFFFLILLNEYKKRRMDERGPEAVQSSPIS